MDLDDQYVANALKNDAQRASDQYASRGLSAYAPKRSVGSAPKPNTRFLRNIIRETDSHNAGLLARERREARDKERRRARHDGPDRRGRGRLSPYDDDDERPRKRQRSIERYSRKQKRVREDSRDTPKRDKYGHSERERHHSRSRSPKRRVKGGDKSRRRRSSSGSERPSTYSNRKRSENRRVRHIGRNRATQSSEDDTPRASPNDTNETRRVDNGRSPPTEPKDPDSDSDPLETIVGPAPPTPEDRSTKIRRRGRGAMASNRAAMDEHFASSYNPKIDVQPDPATEDDWDQALEALRDRQRWKQQGADRLKAAGFTDEEVKKWAKGDERDDSDVRWSKQGEDREWDRGKVVEGDVGDSEPSWGRLKNS